MTKKLKSFKLHFTTSRPPSRVPSRIFILDEGCQVSVGNDCRNRRFRHKLDNPCQEQKFLMELLMEVLTWWNAAKPFQVFKCRKKSAYVDDYREKCLCSANVGNLRRPAAVSACGFAQAEVGQVFLPYFKSLKNGVSDHGYRLFTDAKKACIMVSVSRA